MSGSAVMIFCSIIGLTMKQAAANNPASALAWRRTSEKISRQLASSERTVGTRAIH